MTKYQLELFNDLILTKSFSKTAKHFNTAYQNVIYQITKLEEEFDTTFFIRNKSVTLPTLAGEAFSKHSNHLIREYNELKAKIKELTKTIVLGVDDFLYNPLISQYLTNTENKPISTHPINCSYFMESLNNGDISCFLGFENILDKTTYFKPFYKDKLCLVLSNDHKLAKYETISINDIKDCIIDLTKFPYLLPHDVLKTLGEFNTIKTDIIPAAFGHLLVTGKTITIIPYLYKFFYPRVFKYTIIENVTITHGIYYKYESDMIQEFADKLKECAIQIEKEQLLI